MKTSKSYQIPENFTGRIESKKSGFVHFLKNGGSHREDGPSFIGKDGYKAWRLNGSYIFDSDDNLDLRNQIILSKTQHPEYPTVQVWKILDSEGIYEQIIIPGMEEYIQE